MLYIMLKHSFDLKPFSEVLIVILVNILIANMIYEFVSSFIGNNIIGIIVYWILYTISICCLIYLLRRRYGWKLSDFGLTMKYLKKSILFGTVIIMPFILVEAMLVMMFYDSFIGNGQDNPFAGLNVFEGLICAFIAYPILSILWAEFHEEFRFRGYMQNLIGREYNSVVAFIGISIYFALSHSFSHPEYNVLALVYLLFPAFIFGLEFLVYKNIVVTMTSHFWVNVIQVWVIAICYYFGLYAATVTILFIGGVFMYSLIRFRNILVGFTRECMEYLRVELKYYVYGILLGVLLLIYSYIVIVLRDILIQVM